MAKAYRASGTGCGVTASSPREAAEAFFSQWPNKRKCNIVQGEVEGGFFSVRYGRASAGEWPESWKEITKNKVPALPGAPTENITEFEED